MNFSKKELLGYLDNPFVFELVHKVILFNFQSHEKTDDFMTLLRDFLCSDDSCPSCIDAFLSKYSLGLSQEKNRVNGKINDLSNIISEYAKTTPKSLLDIGVGNGNIITSIGKELSIAPKNLYGVDVVDYSKNDNFNHIFYDQNQIPLENKSLDCIFIMMVLHHTYDPSETLKEASRIIKDDGIVIIRETNAYNEDLIQFNVLMEYIFYYILLKVPAQITRNYYSDEKWESLFKASGFNYKKVSQSSLEENVFTGMYYVLTKGN